MRHLGLTIEHKETDKVLVQQTMIRHPKKGLLVESKEKRELTLTYAQLYDLVEQGKDFLGDYDPEQE